MKPTSLGLQTVTNEFYPPEGYDENVYNGVAYKIASSVSENYKGFYVFTYANCMVTIPVYNLQLDREYKVAACLCNSSGSYQVKVLTYYITVNALGDVYLVIYNKENFIPVDWTTYLLKIALY